MVIDEAARTISLRQSWLNTAFRCPEQARLDALDVQNGIVHPTSDEALIGTAAHWGIEQVIEGNCGPSSIASAVEHFLVNVNEEEYRLVKRESFAEMIAVAQRCATAWVSDIMPQMPLADSLVEKHFNVEWIEHNGWTIVLSGTVDLAPKANTLIDHKTAGSDYRQKDKQMWAVQPTVYCLAAMLGGIRDDVTYTWPMTFTYGVMVKLKGPCRGQILTVERNASHVSFLEHRVRGLVDLYDAVGFETPWPMIDEGNWLCSAVWCSHYSKCRGAHISRADDLFGYVPKQRAA